MMTPWIYVGMMFSAFCWHCEDHFAYSINYLHGTAIINLAGDTKSWYGVPASDADNFDRVMREQLPHLFELNPDLLFDITTLLSPWTLQSNGVKVYGVNQHAGEFVVTYPRAYHAGFNQGFNIAEAVNFAPPEWLPYGEKCIQIYSKFSKIPVFCHQQLLIDIAKARKLDPRTAGFILLSLYELVEKERMDLEGLPSNIPVKRLSPSEQDSHCLVCNCSLRLSYISCICCQGNRCLEHAKVLCSNIARRAR